MTDLVSSEVFVLYVVPSSFVLMCLKQQMSSLGVFCILIHAGSSVMC
jgi:hypothetical protein